jgi:uncharacterized protein with GYD domain
MGFFAIFWDLDDDPRGNVRHIALNDLTVAEVSEVLQKATDTDTSRASGYPAVFGETTTGKHVMVVYEEVERDIAYRITAYKVPTRA